MKPITVWQSCDGVNFTTQAECAEYEAGLETRNLLDKATQDFLECLNGYEIEQIRLGEESSDQDLAQQVLALFIPHLLPYLTIPAPSTPSCCPALPKEPHHAQP